ncbi:MAG: efflux RND transporter periplasmic adaptor subunit [Planctomycetota bacterium]|nr:efflux RND transporter periplasmic adaptor subunit [Planctomycetota bacterium]
MPDLWRKLGGWILLLAILGGGYALLHLVVLAPDPIEVRVEEVHRGVVERIVTNTRAGSIQSRLRSKVSTDRAARIVEILHREGARVEISDPIVKLDDATAQAALRVAQQDLEHAKQLEEQARVSRADAQREFDRYEELHRKNTVSQSEMDRATTRLELARTALKVASSVTGQRTARLAQARLDVEKMILRAPFAGVLTEVFLEVGEWAIPGKPILELIDPGSLDVRAELDEIDTEEIQTGLPVRIQLDPFPGQLFDGTITRVAPYVSEARDQNRTVEIEVRFTSEISSLPLKAGMSADIEVILEQKPESTLRVSTLAIMEGNRVLVVRDGKASLTTIETGLRNWEFTEVTAGLSEGDRVIVSLDRKDVTDGAQVTIVPQPER